MKDAQLMPSLRPDFRQDFGIKIGAVGDDDYARPLLKAALRQFEDIGMTGWIRRAEQLEAQLG